MKPRIKIIIWIGILIIAALVIIFRGRVEMDISLFLPQSSSPQEQFLINQFRQGPGAKLLIMSLQGSDSESLAQLSNSLIKVLKNDKAFVKALNSDSAISPQTEKFLFSNRYLLSPTISPERFSPDSLHDLLSGALGRMTLSQGFMEKRYFARDPTGEFLSTLRSWTEMPMLNKKHGVWFSEDGKHAFLIAEIFAEGFNLDHFEKAVHVVKDSFNELRPNSSVTLNMVGPPVFAVASRDSVRRDATMLSIIATCFVIGIIYLFYRSLRLVLICAVPLLCALLVSVSAIVLIFGSIHGITLAFGIVIIGVAIDYPIHLFSHIRVDEHPSEAMDRIWPTLRLGVLTTALGYVAMIFSNFGGLVQLAAFTVCGLVTSAWVTHYVLPHILGFSLHSTLPRGATAIPLEILSKGKILFFVLLAGAMMFLFSQRNELWENDIAQLSPVPASQLALDRQLREDLKLPNVSYWVVVKGDTEQSVLKWTESVAEKLQVLKSQGAISGFDAATSYLPSIEKQTQRLKALPSTEQLKENLRIAQKGLPFQENAFNKFIEEVSKAKNSEFLTYDRLQGTLLEARIKKLFYNQGDYWFSLISFKASVDKKLVTGAVRSFPSENVFILEPRQTSNNLINRYRDRALLYFGWGALIIIITLRMVLGQWVSTGRVLMPILGSVITVVAILVAAEIKLSLFHLVSLLLVIGLGIDYALFLNRELKLKEERFDTHHALIVCNLSTVSVFGTLAFSTTPILRAIGTTVAIGAFFVFCTHLFLRHSPKY